MSTVLIVGANRGIGLALAKYYKQKNWTVWVTARDPNQAAEMMETADEVFELEVNDESQLLDLNSKLAGRPIDLLIHNAGIYGPKSLPIGCVEADDLRVVLDVNTIAPLMVIQTVLPNIEAGELKKIAVLSSKVGSMSDNQSGGNYAYRASKAALNSIIKSLSIDLHERHIAVIALHPGWVKTDMGGPNALIDVETSAEGLARQIDVLGLGSSGTFIDYKGEVIPW